MAHPANPEVDVATRANGARTGGLRHQTGMPIESRVLPGDFRRRVEWWHKVSSYLHLFGWSGRVVTLAASVFSMVGSESPISNFPR